MAIQPKAFADLITFSRASTGGRFGPSGLYETVATGQPRFDYDPVTLAAKGLLIEEARTNLLKYSDDLSNALWIKTGGNLSVASYASGAWTITDSGSGDDQLGQAGVTIAADSASYTISVDVLKVASAASDLALALYIYGGTAIYAVGICNAVTGVMTAGSGSPTTRVRDMGSFWRFSLTQANNGTNTGINSRFYPAHRAYGVASTTRDNAATGSHVFRRPQLEQGGSATSYIPTTSAQVTRAAEVASINTLSPWFNAAEGTVVCKFVDVSNPVANTPLFLLDGPGTNLLRVRRDPSGLLHDRYVNGSTLYAITSGPPAVAGTSHTVAVGWDALGAGLAVDGGTPATTAAAPVPAVTLLRFGSHQYNPTALNGHIRSLRYYPRRLTNPELQAITL